MKKIIIIIVFCLISPVFYAQVINGPVDLTPYNNKISQLNKLLADANALNAKLMNDLDKLKNDLEAEKAKKSGGETIYVPGETKIIPAPFAIYFLPGKSSLSPQQKYSIIYYVESCMAPNKDRVFEIVGASNSAVGSAKIIERLGQERIDAVLNVINACGGNYKISEKNLGGTSAFSYTDKSKNDVVIIK